MSLHVAVLLASALMSGQPAATETRIGDWLVAIRADGLQLAQTFSDAGAALGVFCEVDTSSCTAFVVTTIDCEEGATVPMMLNSRTGAGGITTTCRHLPADKTGPTLVMNVVNEFATMMQALEGGDAIGIAMPMADGVFRALRFSTVGAIVAIREAMTMPPAPRDESDAGPAIDRSEL